MASRQEEKERRRQERLEREAKEQKSASNRRRLQLVGGAVLALAGVAAVVVALITVIGGGDGDGPRQIQGDDARREAASLPTQKETDVEAAAKAAGCKLTNPEYEGAGHQERKFTPADYKTNPPTSGDHFPTWYEDGVYEPGTTPDLGQLVHTLEHGRINVQYKKGTPADVVRQLEAFVAENEGYHMLLYENTTNMPAQVSATAWTHSLTCDQMNPQVFDAMRTFRDEYIDKGPEKIP